MLYLVGGRINEGSGFLFYNYVFVSSKSFWVAEQLAGSFFFTSIGMPLVSAHVIKLTVSHSQPFFFVMPSL